MDQAREAIFTTPTLRASSTCGDEDAPYGDEDLPCGHLRPAGIYGTPTLRPVTFGLGIIAT